jgi:hypothetical protein
MSPSQNEPHCTTSNLLSLNVDLIYRILDYLRAQRRNTNHANESCRDLISLAFTNQLFNKLLFKSCIYDDHADNSQFDALFGCHGKRYWNNLYRLEHLLTNKCTLPRPPKQPSSTSFNSLQILSEERELDSLRYYDSSLVQPAVPCTGYFGFEVLPREVAVFGDFSGVSFHSNVSDFVSCTKPSGTLLSSYQLQVMVVLQECGYLFLGFSNGDIDCLQVKSSASRATSTKRGGEVDETQQGYPYISGSAQMHTNEITSLAKVSSYHLASGSIASSKILIHWNALKDGNLNRISLLDFKVDSVLSISSCVGSDGLVQLAVGGTPGRMLIHSVWTKDVEANLTVRNKFPSSDDDEAFHFPEGFTKNTRFYLRQKGHVVHLSHHDEHLIVGTNKGSISVMNKDNNMFDPKYTLKNCCSGSIVESVKVFGNILVTAGGSDGCIRFWDWKTGVALVKWLIHPGREIQGKSIKGTVMSINLCHERSSMIALCHDGYVCEICIDEIEKKYKHKKQTLAQRRKRSTSDDSGRMKSSELIRPRRR